MVTIGGDGHYGIGTQRALAAPQRTQQTASRGGEIEKVGFNNLDILLVSSDLSRLFTDIPAHDIQDLCNP